MWIAIYSSTVLGVVLCAACVAIAAVATTPVARSSGRLPTAAASSLLSKFVAGDRTIGTTLVESAGLLHAVHLSRAGQS